MRFDEDQVLSSETWAELLELVNGSTPQGDWIFRGLKTGPDQNQDLEILSHFDEAWRRTRPIKAKELRPLYEAWMLRDFRRQAHHHLPNLPDRTDLLEWLALGRHYGMPVRLVDFTYSFYVAAYFAMCRRINEDSGWVLAFNHKWHKDQLEASIVPGLTKQCGISDHEAAFQDSRLFRKFAVSNSERYVAAVAPFRRNPRLAAQQGLFLCPANIQEEFEHNLNGALPSDPKERKGALVLIELPCKLRTETMKEMLRMNISAASLFPDLSGWAESQGDHVHQDIQDDRFRQELELEFIQPR